jgi:predicted RNase H-like nuclease (RuvC/YqgF family)
VLKYFSGIDENEDEVNNETLDQLNDSIDTTNINLNSTSKMNASLLFNSTMDDGYHSGLIKDLENQISKLKEENGILKNDLEDAKSEVNRLNTNNENLNLQMKA